MKKYVYDVLKFSVNYPTMSNDVVAGKRFARRSHIWATDAIHTVILTRIPPMMLIIDRITFFTSHEHYTPSLFELKFLLGPKTF